MPARQHFLRWIGALVALLLVVLAYRHVELGQLLTLEQLKASRDMLRASYDAAPVRLLAGFFAVYVLATALSIPGATILTLAAGAIFGFATGLVLVSFASSLGALLAFLAARFLLRDTVQHRFGRRLEPINEGMRRDGGLYLLTLRLVPLFPFWLINLLMGLTPIGAGRFYGLSQLGMLPGTAVYVNAGTQLASIGTPADILSPETMNNLFDGVESAGSPLKSGARHQQPGDLLALGLSISRNNLGEVIKQLKIIHVSACKTSFCQHLQRFYDNLQKLARGRLNKKKVLNLKPLQIHKVEHRTIAENS